MIYPRKILNQIRKQLKSKEIIVLTGMRRTGKTTLYKMIFNQIKSNNKVFLGKSVLNIADRAYVLDKGKVVAQNTAKNITDSNILEKVFMGKMK